jgi:hypothetical protein
MGTDLSGFCSRRGIAFLVPVSVLLNGEMFHMMMVNHEETQAVLKVTYVSSTR